jgi:hypothetical protein
MLDTLIEWRDALDSSLGAMGPIVTIVLAFAFSFGMTQWAKDWIKLLGLRDNLYDILVRTFAALVAFAFAKLLGGLRSWVFALGVGFLQPVVVHVALQFIWQRWPHLKTTRALGSTNPTADDIESALAHGTKMRPAIVSLTESGRFKIDPLDTQRMRALSDARKDKDANA